MINWLIFCSFIFSFAMTLLGLIIDINYQVRFVPQIERIQREQSKTLEGYLQAKSDFAKHPFFNASNSNKRDFSELLKNKIMRENEPLVPIETKKSILALGPHWLEKRHIIRPSEKWDQLFSQVHHFDHWNLTPEDLKNSSLLPTDFIILSQIYLANSIHLSPDDILISLEQTRHLSQLLLSTQILNFKLAGLSLLEKENQLIQFMNTRKYQGYESWKTIPLAEIKRFRDFLNQSDSYLTFLTQTEVLEKVFLENDLPVGTCALYLNKNKLLSLTKTFLKPQFVFEPSFRLSIEKMDQISEKIQKHCYLSFTPQMGHKTLTQSVPYFRRVVGIRYLIQESKNL